MDADATVTSISTADLQRPGQQLPLRHVGRRDARSSGMRRRRRLVERFGELARHAEQARRHRHGRAACRHGAARTRMTCSGCWSRSTRRRSKIDLDTSHFHTQGLEIGPVIDEARAANASMSRSRMSVGSPRTTNS